MQRKELAARSKPTPAARSTGDVLREENDRVAPAKKDAKSGAGAKGEHQEPTWDRKRGGKDKSNEPKWVLELRGLKGDPKCTFSLDLGDCAMHQFVSVYREANLADDYVFHGCLRWLAAMYFYFGGERFLHELAEGLSNSDSTASRWLSGQSVPAPRLRHRIIGQAFAIVGNIRSVRESGLARLNANADCGVVAPGEILERVY